MPRIFRAVPECIESRSKEVASSLGLPWKNPGMPRLIIGRREWIALPDLGISPLKAKIDSGARSSSLHAEDLAISEDKKTVRFTTTDHKRRKIQCESPIARIARVRSSSGEAFSRVFIETKASLPGGFEWTIQLSLSDRSVMLCPMLLGRRALSGYFLIDPQSAHLIGPLKEL
jgi:hypothetical protein